jgi:chromosome segregation ATPase
MYIYDIINFSSVSSLSQIPQFLKKKTEEKEGLEVSVKNLYRKLNELKNIQKEKEQEMENLSEIIEKMSNHYRLFTIAKYKLDKYGISMENLNEFVNCVRGIAKEKYYVTNVLEIMGDYDNFVYYIQYYKKEVEAKKAELDKLNQEINYCKGLLDSYKIKLDIIYELERMDFGINELRVLFNTLNEIGRENNKSLDEIKKEFFHDLKNYHEIISSRKKRDRLQSEIKNLEMQMIKERDRYDSYPKVIESIEIIPCRNLRR